MTQTIKDSRLIAFSILGFIFAFFGWQLPLILVIAYALAIAKDDVLSKQSLQALYLYIGYTIIITVAGWGFTALTWFFSLVRAFGFVSFLASAQSVIMFLLGALLLLMVLLAVFKLLKGDAPNLPLIGHLAELTLGIAKPKPKKSYAAPAAQTQAPAASTPPPAPGTPPSAPGSSKTPSEPEKSIDEPKPAQPATPQTTWTCSCGRENKGNFCVACGKPKG